MSNTQQFIDKIDGIMHKISTGITFHGRASDNGSPNLIARRQALNAKICLKYFINKHFLCLELFVLQWICCIALPPPLGLVQHDWRHGMFTSHMSCFNRGQNLRNRAVRLHFNAKM